MALSKSMPIGKAKRTQKDSAARRSKATSLLAMLATAVAGIWFWNYYGTRRIVEAIAPYNWLHPARGKVLFDPRTRILYQGNYRLREIALTIDDGPHEETGSDILDLLKKEDVKATFFVVGRLAKSQPDLIRRMVAEGHELGNHSQNHNRLDQLNGREMYREILDCDKAVRSITRKRMALLRPPGMRYNGAVVKASRENNHVIVSWTCAPKDFMDVSPTYIVNNVMEKVKNGSILLMHDQRPMTVTALARIIPALKREGYKFVTISEMLAHLPQRVTRNQRGRWEPESK